MASEDYTVAKPRSLAGKVAVVIGGGRGIGHAAAHKLAAAGAYVTVAARTVSELEAVVAAIKASGGQVNWHAVDVTQSNEVQALADELWKTQGRVDVLVNSAGVSLIASLDNTAEADWDLILDTNLKGPYLVIRAMLDLLRASDGAHVINIASKVGLTGYTQVTAYVAAKAGLIGFGRALTHEFRSQNIRFTTICSGPVDTPMRWAATPNMDPMLAVSAETVADTILFLATLDPQAAIGSEIVIAAANYEESEVELNQ
jgi:NAD(P)-dependent dehydrogenase (short-subunit alcohol dehydrogenase family)